MKFLFKAEIGYIETDETNIYVPLSYILSFLSVYYVIENVLKIWIWRWKVYSSSLYNCSDLIISSLNWILQIVHFGLFKHVYVTKE